VKKRFLKSLPEWELARFQSLQKGNDCALHAISAALALLCGTHLAPEELASEVNRLWWRGRLFRVLPNWAVTPPMQAAIVNYLARSRGLPVRARLLHLSPKFLRNFRRMTTWPHWSQFTGAAAVRRNLPRRHGLELQPKANPQRAYHAVCRLRPEAHQ
jgi:hypothetical protein